MTAYTFDEIEGGRYATYVWSDWAAIVPGAWVQGLYKQSYGTDGIGSWDAIGEVIQVPASAVALATAAAAISLITAF